MTAACGAAGGREIFDTATLLAGIRRWVECESPSTDAAAVNRMVDLVEQDALAAKLAVQRFPGRDGYGDHLLVATPQAGSGPGVLVLSHLDTVHPVGALDGALPFRVEGDFAYGPGIADMKGGAFLGFTALRHLVAQQSPTPLPIRQLFVSDEEVGSPTSRALIEAEAARAKFVLVTEPARQGGKVVTARKGTALFKLHIKGRPAHSGTGHQDGRSAVSELARQILALNALTDYASGVTVNVGVVAGGTRANIVPAEAHAEIDMRLPTPELADEMIAKALGLMAHDPDVTLTVTGGLNRPPYIKSPGIESLFDHACRLAAQIGFALEDLATSGASDGNFTAASAPTLDGLGVDGVGAHTSQERLYISSLVPRCRLLLRLMETLR
ncbi:M20 family metallopeptidase [Bosea minatitlanensis]|uniref:M20 family metallopeptidase n=1 Tax=Bosea minatitlanensis TaxID=128782 RepID=A0ABW0F158_9HYPH|nr:M20 family metallopeptidase [Bosea minatitlanensis]MCT4494164.1 M20 family metallopeptidase [Bosea minatitlanensis]